jgi:hypothetical protein
MFMRESRRTDIEIAEEIAELLDPRSCGEIKPRITEYLMMHRYVLTKKYSRDAIKENRAAAKTLRKTIDKLMASVQAAPVHLVMAAPRPRKIAGLGPPATPTLDDVFDYLWGMRQACELAERESASLDKSKIRSADLAYTLIKMFSKRRPTSFRGSLLRRLQA